MKRLAIAVTALLIGTSASAGVCSWKDKDGKTVFSDKPPTGVVTNSTCSGGSTAAAGSAAPKTAADKDLDFKKRQKEAAEKAEKKAKEEREAREKRQFCDQARRDVAALGNDDQRFSAPDENGQMQLMDAGQRAAERDRLIGKMNEYCK